MTLPVEDPFLVTTFNFKPQNTIRTLLLSSMKHTNNPVDLLVYVYFSKGVVETRIILEFL